MAIYSFWGLHLSDPEILYSNRPLTLTTYAATVIKLLPNLNEGIIDMTLELFYSLWFSSIV